MDWQWAGIISAGCLVAWAVAGILWPDAFLRAVHLAPTSPRGQAESAALYIGAFGGVGVVALLASTPESYAVAGGMWLGLGAVRTAWCMTAWQMDRYLAAAIPFELALGVLGLLPWALA